MPVKELYAMFKTFRVSIDYSTLYIFDQIRCYSGGKGYSR